MYLEQFHSDVILKSVTYDLVKKTVSANKLFKTPLQKAISFSANVKADINIHFVAFWTKLA